MSSTLSLIAVLVSLVVPPGVFVCSLVKMACEGICIYKILILLFTHFSVPLLE